MYLNDLNAQKGTGSAWEILHIEKLCFLQSMYVFAVNKYVFDLQFCIFV